MARTRTLDTPLTLHAPGEETVQPGGTVMPGGISGGEERTETEPSKTSLTVWADIRPLSGRERLRAQQAESTISHEITLRRPIEMPGGEEMTPTGAMHLTGSSRTGSGRRFEIDAAYDPTEDGAWWELLCTEDRNR